jgi:hypothetical protein
MKKLVLILVVLTVGYGCKEKFVPYVVDKDEIQRYLDSTEIGRDLFRWDSLIIPMDYALPFGSATWRDTVLSHERLTTINIASEPTDFGTPIGIKRTADIKVTDIFGVRTRRIYATDTTYIDADRIVNRQAMFIKLGSDLEPYVGWVLWKYRGSTDPLRVLTLIKLPNQTASAVDQDQLVKLTDIKTFTDGVTLILNTTSIIHDTLRQPMLLLTAATDGGFVQRNMTKIDRQHYTDTLKTPTNNSRLWNLIFIQTFHDNEFFFTGGFFIPYRIPQ